MSLAWRFNLDLYFCSVDDYFCFQITTIIHEPNNIVYLEFYISVDGTPVNATDVVETFKVPHVNLLNTDLEVEVSNDHVQIIALGSTLSLPLPLLISLTPEKVKQFRFP